jgi:hypothetical protein
MNVTRRQTTASGQPQRWLGLLLLLLLPSAAWTQGTIVHRQLSTPNPDPNFPWDFQGLRLLSGFDPIYYQMDLNGDGTAEYQFDSSISGFHVTGTDNNHIAAFLSLNTFFTLPLDSMSPVGSDVSPFTWASGLTVITSCRDIGCIGLYTGVESAYAGLQFQIEGQTHYGWVRLGAPIAGLNGGWIYEYAYETRPDTPILAGAVPEPSTWALLGTGGLLFWWYGRRQGTG